MFDDFYQSSNYSVSLRIKLYCQIFGLLLFFCFPFIKIVKHFKHFIFHTADLFKKHTADITFE